jgi:hypothetical protein
MPEQKLEVLSRAILLIEDEENWTTKAFARTKDNYPLTPLENVGGWLSPGAEHPVCWCALGAMIEVINRVRHEQELTTAWFLHDLRYEAAEDFMRLYNVPIEDVNDEHGHEEVLTCLRALATHYAEEGQDV